MASSKDNDPEWQENTDYFNPDDTQMEDTQNEQDVVRSRPVRAAAQRANIKIRQQSGNADEEDDNNKGSVMGGQSTTQEDTPSSNSVQTSDFPILPPLVRGPSSVAVQSSGQAGGAKNKNKNIPPPPPLLRAPTSANGNTVQPSLDAAAPEPNLSDENNEVQLVAASTAGLELLESTAADVTPVRQKIPWKIYPPPRKASFKRSNIDELTEPSDSGSDDDTTIKKRPRRDNRKLKPWRLPDNEEEFEDDDDSVNETVENQADDENKESDYDPDEDFEELSSSEGSEEENIPSPPKKSKLTPQDAVTNSVESDAEPLATRLLTNRAHSSNQLPAVTVTNNKNTTLPPPPPLIPAPHVTTTSPALRAKSNDDGEKVGDNNTNATTSSPADEPTLSIDDASPLGAPSRFVFEEEDESELNEHYGINLNKYGIESEELITVFDSRAPQTSKKGADLDNDNSTNERGQPITKTSKPTADDGAVASTSAVTPQVIGIANRPIIRNLALIFDQPFTTIETTCDARQFQLLCDIIPALKDKFSPSASPSSTLPPQPMDHDPSMFGPPYSVQNVGGSSARFYDKWKKTSVLPEDVDWKKPTGTPKLLFDAIKQKINYTGPDHLMKSDPKFLEEMRGWEQLEEQYCNDNNDTDKEKAYRPIQIVNTATKPRRGKKKPAPKTVQQQLLAEEEEEDEVSGLIHHDVSTSSAPAQQPSSSSNQVGKVWMKWQNNTIYYTHYNGPSKQLIWESSKSLCSECWGKVKIAGRCNLHNRKQLHQILLLQDTNNKTTPTYAIIKPSLRKELRTDTNIIQCLTSEEIKKNHHLITAYLEGKKKQESPVNFQIIKEFQEIGLPEATTKYNTIKLAVSLMIMLHNTYSKIKIHLLAREIHFLNANLDEVKNILLRNGYQLEVGEEVGINNSTVSPILHEEYDPFLPYSYFTLGGPGQIYSGEKHSPRQNSTITGSAASSKTNPKKGQVGTKMKDCYSQPMYQSTVDRAALGIFHQQSVLTEEQQQIFDVMKREALHHETLTAIAVLFATMNHDSFGGFPITSANAILNHYNDITNLDNLPLIYKFLSDKSRTLTLPDTFSLINDNNDITFEL